MKSFLNIVSGILSLLVCLAVIGWLCWRTLQRSDDPARLIGKWILTAVVLILCVAATMMIGWSPILPGVAAVFGIVLTLIWGSSVGELMARPFVGMIDGGNADGEPVPLYSIAEAKRKRGKYDEAIVEVRKQLAQFPSDFQGQMLLAEIQAENQLNVTGAVETIDELVAQPGHAPKNIAFALNRCADWELKLRQDPQAARRALERIVELLPDTEQAQVALQRIAHLASPELLAEQQEPPRIALKHFEDRLGLRTRSETPQPEEPKEDTAQLAAAHVKRLEEFPADNETREKLAVLYAEQYQRLDLAEEQLEQLIAVPNQPPKQVVHWLNVLADVQVKTFGDVERARQTLHRIPELFPKSAFAENALNRIAYLNLEARAKQKSQAVKLGSYEKYLGLK